MQRIVGERQQQKKDSLEQETRYRVKWASVTTGPGAGNWSADEHDSWEPLCNMPGCEGHIRAMREEKADATATAVAAEAARKEAKRLKRAAAERGGGGEGEEVAGGEDSDHLLRGSQTSKVSGHTIRH